MSASVRDYTILGVTQARGSTGSGGGGVVSGGAIALETSQHDIEGLEHTNRTGALLAGNVISPAELVADTDDWSPTSLSTADVIRASMDSAHALTGLAALTASSGAGKALIVANVGTVDMTLTHEDASSTAINRFLCPNDEDLTLSPDAWVLLWYDATSERWRVTGTGSASSDPGASLVPYYLGAGESFNVPVGRQALFADAIELDADATIEVDGELIEVDATPAAPASTTPSGVRNQPVYPMPLLFGEQGEDGEPGARGETGARGASGTGSSSSAASGPYAMVGESDTEDAIDRAIAVVDHRVLVQEVDGAPSGLVDGFVYPNDSVTLVGGKAVIRQVPYGFIGASAYHNTSQNVVDATDVTIALNTKQFDTDGFWASSGIFTVPPGLGGKYLVGFNLPWDGNATGTRYARILKNNATVAGLTSLHDTPGANNLTQSGAGIVDLAAGDTIRLIAFGNSGGTRTVGTVNPYEMASVYLYKLDSGRVGSGIGASVYNAGSQTVNGSNLTYDTTVFDTNGFHTTTSRMTIPAGMSGMYLLEASLYDTTNTADVRFYKNGAQVNGATSQLTLPAANRAGSIGMIVQAVAGDYFEVNVYTSGANHTILGSATGYPTAFQIMRLDSSGPTVSRIVRGEVSAAGAVTRGTGFTVSRTSLGHYTVTFTSAWVSIPVVVGSSVDVNVSITGHPYNPSTTAFDFMCAVPNVSFNDAPFTFIAMSID